eukprot:789376-Amphidinium_carterae.1
MSSNRLTLGVRNGLVNAQSGNSGSCGSKRGGVGNSSLAPSPAHDVVGRTLMGTFDVVGTLTPSLLKCDGGAFTLVTGVLTSSVTGVGGGRFGAGLVSGPGSALLLAPVSLSR